MKTCTKCGVEKPLSEFPRDKYKKSGYCSACKKCRYPQRAKFDKKYYDRQKEKDPFYNHRKHMRQRYGITLEEYNKLTKNGCEICGSRKRLVVDHNHKTREIRGCLCNKCNRGLGYFGDNLQYVISAAFYLEKNGSYNLR